MLKSMTMPLADTRSPEELEQIARFKQLTEQLLPTRAQQERWPIRLDHCFKRICLDYAFGDVWYHHVARPAERHLCGAALQRAVACAEELVAGSKALLAERDAASLRVRGKRPKTQSALQRTPRVTRRPLPPS